MSAHRIFLSCALACGLVALSVLPVWGSIFGEENVTLVKILTELIHANSVLEDVSDAAGRAAGLAHDTLRTYQRVNAGIDELRSYTFGTFLRDLTTDFYDQYPGFGQLAYASQNLDRWAHTRTRSPFTAYQAITAVVADVTAPLREDLEAGHANIDRELILAGEAAGGFAAAHGAEQATRNLDSEIADLATSAQMASPGQAAQIQARASVILASQQSHVMRLLSRTVRLESVRAALEYGARLDGRNSMYERRNTTLTLAKQALSPPALIRFDEGD
jgi:hypothetical protein